MMNTSKKHVEAHKVLLKNYTEIEREVSECVDVMNHICNLKVISHDEMRLLAEASIVYDKYHLYFPIACSKIKKMQNYFIEKFIVLQS